MFGFFKKKSGEIPEEQERLQKAAAREAERKEAPAIPEELRALGQKFLPEEFSILAVTGAGGFGGSRPQENGPSDLPSVLQSHRYPAFLHDIL